MESFWSTLSSYAELARDYGHIAIDWAERHSGLAGWVGALGSILAIFIAWYLARREYLRIWRRQAMLRSQEIDLIQQIILDFETLVQSYVEAALAGGPEANNFNALHSNDAPYLGMIDLARLPVIHWPSLQAYDNFKRYWSRSLRLLETSQIQPISRETLALRLKEHDVALPDLRETLEVSRKF